ncbi:glycerophosphodiester phosphodiesterase [Deinococcus sp. KNUC1210]|uniref:glycerophosphodiester phosphodiesterase n=1 Tax=Deinococcus sp. KNUC1210 TaxID=2917691 RepID=UPI001EF0ED86|nr:glycerophosphodiester phosphodiesterase [Deinococcus sp. KNUC1210]ULH15737.1 glycerophosphodiester phosphodiesterase [Deinococcus sp. KNUC1210]
MISRSPLLLGHRGTPRLHHENTLPGFQAALDAGLDGVELDVRRLTDGTLAIHHDLNLPDGRALNTLTRSQIPASVPTLAEVLDWAAQTDAYLNVELKFEGARSDDRVSASLKAIRQHGRAGRCIVSSFSPLMLKAARDCDAGIERGFLYHRRYRLGIDLVPVVARRLDVTALHPHHSLIDEELMALARQERWRVNAWTVNEPGDVQRLTALGVDGLIGDVPETLLEARRS